MGLSVYTQDLVLNWLRGQRIGLPAEMLWLSFHSDKPAASLNEISQHFGGRVALIPGDLSEPVNGPGGLREITNLRALVSQPVDAEQRLLAVGLWTAQTGGQLLISGVYEPELTVNRGDPAVLLAGHLRLRATA